MEPSGKEKKGEIGGRVLLAAGVALMLWALWQACGSPVAKSIRAGQPVRIIFMTEPPAIMDYDKNASSVKLTFLKYHVGRKGESLLSQAESISQLTESRGHGDARRLLYFTPQTLRSRPDAWEASRKWMETWREQPTALYELWHEYRASVKAGATNVDLHDFLLLATNFVALGRTDFIIFNQQITMPSGLEDSSAPVSDQPLRLEVINASGRGGLAVRAARCLREYAQGGVHNIDVIGQDNASRQEEQSRIILHDTARQGEASLLSEALGMGAVILDVSKPYKDATILLGRDFNDAAVRACDWKSPEMLH